MAWLLCAVSFVAACDTGSGLRLPRPTAIGQQAPLPPPPPAPPPGPATPISLGQEVRANFVGSTLAFELTAPSNGTLVARLTWDPWSHGSLLILTMASTQLRGVDPHWSPIVGKIEVAAGQVYRLTVSKGGTDMWYDEAFVLTTSME
jgi:hypothetical protein